MSVFSPLKKPGSTGGFALVIALALMAFVVLLLLSITTLVRIETRSATASLGRLQAEQNALLGLMVGLGDLQKATGADQRVTATASLLNASAAGNRYWVGVWDSSSHDRLDPANTWAFRGWLVSAPENSGVDQLDYPEDGVVTDGLAGVELFAGRDSAGSAVPENSIHAPLVAIDGGSSKVSAYAYAIEDEGLKAKVSWNEDEERVDRLPSSLLQRSRLSAPPGVDTSVFAGPFASELNYPLTDPANRDFLSSWSRVQQTDQLRLLGDADPGADWLESQRHNLTLASKGLLTDTKNGGLKRDLSLAFEMDAAEEDPNQLTNFNQAIGEFVGSGGRSADPHSAIYQVGGQNFFTRFIFADNTSGGIARGGTWHAMRDYYNLYKRLRLSSSGSGYEMDLQPYFPNRSELSGVYDLFYRSRFAQPSGFTDVYTQELGSGGQYRYMPSRGSYTPILLGYRFALTLVPVDWDSDAGTGGLALAFDPFFYLWNPYDQAIRFENIKIQYSNLPLLVSISVEDPSGDQTYRAFLDDYIIENVGGLNKFETFLNDGGEDVVMEPGEILVFSSQQAGTSTESWPGPQLNDNSGILLRNHPETGGLPIPITEDSLIDVEMTTDLRNAILPDDFANPWTSKAWFITNLDFVADDDLSYAIGRQNDPQRRTKHLQHVFINMASPVDSNANWDRTVVLSDISVSVDMAPGVKYPVGYFDNLMKGTRDDADGTMRVAPFAHFNPTSTFQALRWSWVPPNRFSLLEAEPNINAMLPSTINDGKTSWGDGYASLISGGVDIDTTTVSMREIPTTPPVSLATMGSADIAPFIFDPVRTIGESSPSPLIALDGIHEMTPAPHAMEIYDSTWLANDALWDRYFFSGIVPDYQITAGGYSPQGNLGEALADFLDEETVSAHLNSRIQPIGAAEAGTVLGELDPVSSVDGYKRIAEYVFQDGVFNINSSSVEAWTALLRSNRDLVLGGRGGVNASPGSGQTPFPKTAEPLADDGDSWAGYASLSDLEIDRLAAEIVNQVKLRGPFMGLSDFVNRRIESGALGEAGALQAAINAANLNSAIQSEGATPEYTDTNLFPDGTSADWGNTASGIGGYLTQADLLKAIGSAITARSDTFRITAHGQYTNPTSGEIVTARCEAIVQRFPEYVDRASNDAIDEPDALSAINAAFGRRYRVVGFNWLN